MQAASKIVLSLAVLAILSWGDPWYVAPVSLLVVGMLWASVRRGWGGWLSFATLLVGFVVYAALRAAVTPGAEDPVFFGYVIRLDTLGGVLPLPSNWLQRHVRFGFLDYLTSATYISYFLVPQVVAVFVWRKGGPFARFVAAALGLFGVAVVVHYFAPTAPPWLASQEGLIPPLDRMLVRILHSLSPALTDAGYGASANDVAAMPSVHQGMTVLAMIAMARTDPRTRWIAWAYSLLMAFSIVYLGEHYVVDAIAGTLVTLVGWRLARRLDPAALPIPRVAGSQPA